MRDGRFEWELRRDVPFASSRRQNVVLIRAKEGAAGTSHQVRLTRASAPSIC
jgi:hypothetical protein